MTDHEARPLNPQAVAYFEKRGLDPELVVRKGIYTARQVKKDKGDTSWHEPIPDANGKTICFPYYWVDGTEENVKFMVQKGHDKIYFQRPDRRKIFYNMPCMADLALSRGEQSLVIVEGENDCIAVEECGHPWTVSVPAGGDPSHDKYGRPIPMKPDHELDPENDIKFEYILNCWDVLEPIKRIIIWTDWDGVGDRLKSEIARRLGKIRCAFIACPRDIETNLCVPFVKRNKDGEIISEGHRACKDANEVKQYYGPERVLQLIAEARMMPVTGLYQLSDFEEVTRTLYSTGFKALDPYIQLYEGCFIASSGLPGSGKSQFWNQVAFNCAFNHHWRIGIASFEAEVKPDLIRQLRAFYLVKDYRDWSSQDKREADAWIEKHFVFITRDPQGLNDVMCNIEWLMEKTEEAVIRFGINMMIIDPWNQIDHQRRPGERGDEYLTRSIKHVKDTGKRLRLATVVIAHPDKGAGRDAAKEGKPMSLYDMADGAAWFNAAEHGVIVFRKGPKETQTRIINRKCKFRGTGSVGDAYLFFDEQAELFDTSLVMAPHVDEGR